MDPAGSIWLPFVTNATSFLKGGGRLAFVLPFDLTYVRYAKPLWRSLGREFGSLRVVRVHERLFPEPLQDVVILLANERGATASAVQYECFERRAELLDGSPTISSNLDLDRIIGDERPFMEALLPGDLQGLLQGRLSRRVPGGVRAASRIDRDDDSLLAKLSPAGPGPGSSSSPPDVVPENVRRAARAPGARAYPEPRHDHARSRTITPRSGRCEDARRAHSAPSDAGWRHLADSMGPGPRGGRQPARATRPANPTQQPPRRSRERTAAGRHERVSSRHTGLRRVRRGAAPGGHRAPSPVLRPGLPPARLPASRRAAPPARRRGSGGRPGRGRPPAQRRSGPHQEEVTSGQRHALSCRSRGA